MVYLEMPRTIGSRWERGSTANVVCPSFLSGDGLFHVMSETPIQSCGPAMRRASRSVRSSCPRCTPAAPLANATSMRSLMITLAFVPASTAMAAPASRLTGGRHTSYHATETNPRLRLRTGESFRKITYRLRTIDQQINASRMQTLVAKQS